MLKSVTTRTQKALLLSGLLFIGNAMAVTTEQVEARMDSLSEYAASTVVGKDDSPISMSGDITTRLRNYHYDEYPKIFTRDKARTFIDGNLNLALAAMPNSYVNFWTILNFPYDLSGYFLNEKATQPNESPNLQDSKIPQHHSTDYYSTTLWEDVTAGIDIRAGQFGGMFKAGGVLWLHSSPLTIWEREAFPKFPSMFETFEEERTVSTYYKEKSFRPVSEGGRAFWTNRSFGGLHLDMYQMPFGMTGQLLFAQSKDNDYGTRDGLRLLAGQPGELEMSGNLDFRADVYHGRIAKDGIGPMSVGASYLALVNDNDLLYEPNYIGTFGAKTPYITNNHVGSIDVKGNLTPDLFLLMDVALSFDDSVKFKAVETDSGAPAPVFPYEQDLNTRKNSSLSPAVYAKVQSKYGIPMLIEGFFASEKFYSPYGMTDYSRNRQWRLDQMSLGAGQFRYSPNLLGANVKLEPSFNRGRFTMLYSLHRQYKAGKDVVAFPYRLTGRSFWETTSAWSKYNTALMLDEAYGSDQDYRYARRIGGTTAMKMENQNGGLRGGTWETWEVFGAFENAKQAKTMEIPEHVKWSSVLSMEAAYDIGNWFGTDRNIMLAVNGTVSGVSTQTIPLAYSETQKGMLLWSYFLQSEPTFAITPTLHGLLIGGVEVFRSERAYGTTTVSRTETVYSQMPINFLETVVGCGIDWDFAPRAGLHLRYKRASHSDEIRPENDWKAHLINAETKIWF